MVALSNGDTNDFCVDHVLEIICNYVELFEIKRLIKTRSILKLYLTYAIQNMKIILKNSALFLTNLQF